MARLSYKTDCGDSNLEITVTVDGNAMFIDSEEAGALEEMGGVFFLQHVAATCS